MLIRRNWPIFFFQRHLAQQVIDEGVLSPSKAGLACAWAAGRSTALQASAHSVMARARRGRRAARLAAW
jgi:hypothetical protein